MAKKEDTFMLVSLEESKARKLAQVISNDTCRKILDFLTKKEATETEIAKELELPLSTVHYNLQQLRENGLISADEFHYSEKGREVAHYSLANKYIIIAPKFSQRLASRLRHILPVAIISLLAGGILALSSRFFAAPGLQQFAADKVSRAPMIAAEDALGEIAAQEAEAFAAEEVGLFSTVLSNPAAWFVIGAFFAIIIFIIVEYVSRRFAK